MVSTLLRRSGTRTNHDVYPDRVVSTANGAHKLTGPTTVLMTGATGFIGRHLARHLAGQGCIITSMQRSNTIVDGIGDTIVIPEFSPAAIAVALSSRRFQLVFHLAGYGVKPDERDIDTMFDVNVDATRAVVRQSGLNGAEAVVIAGSGAEYDFTDTEGPVSEDQALQSRSLYGASKAAGSLTALAMARAMGLPLAVARLFGVFGAGEAPHRLLPSLVGSLSNSERVNLSPGLQRRDALYVEDAVDALVTIALRIRRDPQQIAVNVCSGEAPMVREFAEAVADAMGAPRSLLGFGDIAARPDDVACFAGTSDRLQRLIGWKPSHTLSSGINAAVSEMRARV